MKDVTEKMEKIAGKGDATMGKPEYLRKEKQQAKEAAETQQTLVNLACDYRKDGKQSNMRLSILCGFMGAVIVLMAIFGLRSYDRQQDKYMAQIEALSARNEKLTNDFLAFLNQYDFETTITQETDADNGSSAYNINGGGTVNGIESVPTDNPENETP